MKIKKLLIISVLAGLLLFSYALQESSNLQAQTVKVDTPEPTPVPERIEPKSETDWEAIGNNKNVEIIEVLNILNPVAAYLTAAFEQYDDNLGEITHEEWEDTQAQLNRALAIYTDCKDRMAKKKFDKQLFLDLEEAWQVLVKVGVAGIRAKSMVDSDLARLK
ncbi:MAG: hypothetical protein GY855_14785 [candidate division Zixibacteria bacterium]|nr:hypothetical protein [candidate division Zixibacteria bacterium]